MDADPTMATSDLVGLLSVGRQPNVSAASPRPVSNGTMVSSIGVPM